MYASNVGALVIGQLSGGLIGAFIQEVVIFACGFIIIGSLIGAIVLMAATKWVVKCRVPFGEAYWTVFICSIVNFMLAFVLGFVVGSTGSTEAVRVLQILLLPVGFLIQSGIISWRLDLPFGKACLVSITMIGIVLGIALVVGVVFFLINYYFVSEWFSGL
jgi:hypothetical protein